jgi:hypothetical protein
MDTSTYSQWNKLALSISQSWFENKKSRSKEIAQLWSEITKDDEEDNSSDDESLLSSDDESSPILEFPCFRRPINHHQYTASSEYKISNLKFQEGRVTTHV